VLRSASAVFVDNAVNSVIILGMYNDFDKDCFPASRETKGYRSPQLTETALFIAEHFAGSKLRLKFSARVSMTFTELASPTASRLDRLDVRFAHFLPTQILERQQSIQISWKRRAFLMILVIHPLAILENEPSMDAWKVLEASRVMRKPCASSRSASLLKRRDALASNRLAH